MPLETKSAEEIQTWVRARIQEDREVIEDNATINVPLPTWHQPGPEGNNWDMAVFGGDATAYIPTIVRILADAKTRFRLP